MKKHLFGFDTKSWLDSDSKLDSNQAAADKNKLPKVSHLYIFQDFAKLSDKETDLIPSFKQSKIRDKKGVHLVELESGDHWFLHLKSYDRNKTNHWGYLGQSDFSHARDAAGPLAGKFNSYAHLHVHFFDCEKDIQVGVWSGLEVGVYKYHSSKDGRLPNLPKLHTEKKYEKYKSQGARLGESINIARHLVNKPALELNPSSLADQLKSHFDDMYGCSVEVWDEDRLKAENMNLHVAVGQAAEFRSKLVHIKYRPSGEHKPEDCLAFVGKGITFDSGGLDIKPSAGMRWMKKDKGGAASVIGVAHWAASTKLQKPCDFYLSLAENAVSANAIRPGDVIKSRSGVAVEIHNTDAEGRLVMADAISLAIEKKPAAIINLATLTGAMRVAVGLEISGMLSNHDGLANLALKCSQEMGDPIWRLPLFEAYKSSLSSDFADTTNCSPSGVAGAITAALFLKKFVLDTPWLHFDFMAYTSKPSGALTTPGGSGQMVQALTKFLEDFSIEKFKANKSKSKK